MYLGGSDSGLRLTDAIIMAIAIARIASTFNVAKHMYYKLGFKHVYRYHDFVNLSNILRTWPPFYLRPSASFTKPTQLLAANTEF